MSNKKLTLDDISNLEATKLFEDLGYKLIPDIMHMGDRTLFKYEDTSVYLDQITCIYNSDINNIEVYANRYYVTGGHSSVNIIPLMYPIIKLLQELDINMIK